MSSEEKLEARPLQCQFVVPRKKRFCRMAIKPGRKYCPEHERLENLPSNEILKHTEEADIRIPCPLDPKHTCYASRLEKHLKVCNARRVDLPDYISRGVNSTREEEPSSRACLKDVPLDKLRAAVDMVEKLYAEVVSHSIEHRIESDTVPVHSSLLDDYAQDERRHSSRRHLRQMSSLIRIVEDGLVMADACYVELGAGKGHVSYYLARALQNTPSCSVLLVDRASHRHKQDNKLDPQHHRVERLRADINDLILCRAPPVRRSRHLVAVSKHLCGVATDYALRCVTADETIDKTRGIVMATCCHHRCTFGSYVATDFLMANGINKEYFDIIMGIVSWGTCGTGFSRERTQEMNQNKRQKLAEEVSNDVGKNCEIGALNTDTNDCDKTSKVNVTGKEIVCDINNEESIVHENTVNNSINIENDTKIETENKQVKELETSNSNNNLQVNITKSDIINSENDTQTKTENANINKLETYKVLDSDNNIITKELQENSNYTEINVNYKKLTSVKALGLSVEKRTEIGRHAKAVIDYGRVVFLRKCGFEAKLCFYVDTEVSPENVCIVAKK